MILSIMDGVVGANQSKKDLSHDNFHLRNDRLATIAFLQLLHPTGTPFAIVLRFLPPIRKMTNRINLWGNIMNRLHLNF